MELVIRDLINEKIESVKEEITCDSDKKIHKIGKRTARIRCFILN